MVLKAGWLRIGRVAGAPIRLHWSVPLAVVALTHFRFAPGAWLGVVLLILVHELGHAILVARARLPLVAVDVLGFGGLCRYQGYPTPRQRVLIAWGGILAQALLGLGTLASLLAFGPPRSPFVADLLDVFLYANLWLILFNLMPIPPLDGVEAWGVVALVRAARARRRMDAAEAARVAGTRATKETIRSLDALDEHDLPPMPAEVKRVLERIRAQGRAEHEGDKKK